LLSTGVSSNLIIPLGVYRIKELDTKKMEVALMCSQVMCHICKKPTWSGCGQHIEEALSNVAEQDRCQGHANDPKEPGFMSRLFGGKK
jgi:hypothetical protein